MANIWKPVIIFTKSSILDICLRAKYASGYYNIFLLRNFYFAFFALQE